MKQNEDIGSDNYKQSNLNRISTNENQFKIKFIKKKCLTDLPLEDFQ